MLFDSIVYGPIRSRRLGMSLGMNLMPCNGKLCTFNCIYCECGFNHPLPHPVLPTVGEVSGALEKKLQTLTKAGSLPDVITFSGNGEPTLHPEFERIIQDTCRLRDTYCPDAKVSVLSNATQLGREDVVRALMLCDNRILKLDSAIQQTMLQIDDPTNRNLTIETIMRGMEQFDGDFVLQTCFLRGTLPGGSTIDNTTDDELAAWYAAVRRLHPKQVMIYVIDRATPVKTLEKIPAEQMQRIAEPLVREGWDVQVTA